MGLNLSLMVDWKERARLIPCAYVASGKSVEARTSKHVMTTAYYA